jgi:hypothetical protein
MPTVRLTSLKDLDPALLEDTEEDAETLEMCAEASSGLPTRVTEHEGSSSASARSGPRHGHPGPTHFYDYDDDDDRAFLYEVRFQFERERRIERPSYAKPLERDLYDWLGPVTPPRIVTGLKGLADENPYRYEYRPNDQAWEKLRYHDPPEVGPVSRAAIFQRALAEGLEPAETAEDRAFRDTERLMQGSHRNYGRRRAWKQGSRRGSGDQQWQEAGESYWAHNYVQDDPVRITYPEGGYHIVKEGGVGAWTQDCVMCGESFQAKKSNAKTCSPRCRKRLSRANVTLRPKGEDEMRDAEIINKLAAEYEQGMASFQRVGPLIEQLAAKHPGSELVQTAVDRFNRIALDTAEEIAA